MEQLVRVTKVNPDGTALVLHQRKSACSGDCHACSGCGAVQQKMLLTAQNPIGAQVGDLVRVTSDSGPVLLGAAVLYLLPLVLFFAGYLTGAVLWEAGPVSGIVAFILGICLAAVYDRKVAKKKNTVYTITGFGPKQSGAWGKEDCNRD